MYNSERQGKKERIPRYLILPGFIFKAGKESAIAAVSESCREKTWHYVEWDSDTCAVDGIF